MSKKSQRQLRLDAAARSGTLRVAAEPRAAREPARMTGEEMRLRERLANSSMRKIWEGRKAARRKDHEARLEALHARQAAEAKQLEREQKKRGKR